MSKVFGYVLIEIFFFYLVFMHTDTVLCCHPSGGQSNKNRVNCGLDLKGNIGVADKSTIIVFHITITYMYTVFVIGIRTFGIFCSMSSTRIVV